MAIALVDSNGIALEKSQVSFPPPGQATRFALLGQNKTNPNQTINNEKRAQYGLYYEMYRQHPVVRAAVDKKAVNLIAGGWTFINAEVTSPKAKVDAVKARTLNAFLRASHGKKLFRITYKDLDVFGESFWVIIRAATGKPIKAMRVNPRYMVPKVSGGLIVGWVYGPVTTSDDALQYKVEDIIHFSIEDLDNDTMGLSPLHSLQITVTQDIFAAHYNSNFFANSAQTGTIFIQKTSSGEEAKRNREWIEQNYVGPENAHRPLLIEGDVDVRPSVSSQVEMEFLEGRKFLRQEIMMVLDMDPDKLGLHEDSNRSVSKEGDDAFHSETLWARQSVVEEEINNVLILQTFGWDDILFIHNDGDPRRNESKADIRTKNLHAGRDTINEQREADGKPIYGPEGDRPFLMTPTGLVYLDRLDEVIDAQVAKASTGANADKGGSTKVPSRSAAAAASQNEK